MNIVQQIIGIEKLFMIMIVTDLQVDYIAHGNCAIWIIDFTHPT